ncbi:hypothetical protein L7A49_33205, partial [Achromobacter xylosoxidans]|nr:hypothetical protein [Achromobacter xylosoxidans]
DYEKSEYQISHPLWRDDRSIIVWGPHAGSIHYHLYEDADGGQLRQGMVGAFQQAHVAAVRIHRDEAVQEAGFVLDPFGPAM